MTVVELYVGLKIPDTTAITTLQVIERMGFAYFNAVKRDIFYRFVIEGDPESFVNKASKVDILVNANKNKFKTKADPEHDAIRIIVRDTDDDCKALMAQLKGSLGLHEIMSMERGTFWTLSFEGADKGKAMADAKKIAESLLSNKHYQEFKIFE